MFISENISECLSIQQNSPELVGNSVASASVRPRAAGAPSLPTGALSWPFITEAVKHRPPSWRSRFCFLNLMANPYHTAYITLFILIHRIGRLTASCQAVYMNKTKKTET